MRKLFGMGLMWVSLAAAAGVSPQEQAVLANYPEATTEMKLVQVSPHTYYVQGAAGVATDNQGFISNAGAVVTDDGVVIVDTLGTPALAAKMVRLLREVTDQPIKKVVITHYHADHIYGLQVFKELGAEVYAPMGVMDYLNAPNAKERLEERRFSLDPWVNDSTYLVKPDHIIGDTTQLRQGGVTLTLTFVGAAHSDGDLTVLVEPDRTLYSGDIIFEGRIAYLGDADTRRWLATLEHLETGGVQALIPGHGPAAKEPTAAITQTRRYLAYIREAMGKAVEELVPFEEAYKTTDWSEFANLPAFEAANRRNAYQVYLSMEAETLK